MRRAQAIFLVAMLSMLIAGCGNKADIPDPKPLPAGQSFAGVWYSTQFEHMYLRQTGDEVRGIYTYKQGGTMEGTANGNLLKFTWIDPGNKDEARRSLKGQGWLQMVKEGELIKLKGEWGYNDARSGGGVWAAEYVRKMDPEDPRSLEEWREQQGLSDEGEASF